MQTFFANSKIGNQVVGLRVAVMELSLAGYLVLSVSTKSTSEMASIMIDKPYQCEDVEISRAAEKEIGFYKRWDCRIYWIITA